MQIEKSYTKKTTELVVPGLEDRAQAVTGKFSICSAFVSMAFQILDI